MSAEIPGMIKVSSATEIFNKHALTYQDKFMDTHLYHESFDLFCSSITEEHAAILEIACGPGNVTQYLLQQRPDFNILGTDLSENMLELAAINNPAAAFQLMDCRHISQLSKKYNGVMCSFCLPYLSKEEAIQLIHDVSGLLKPGGVFYVSTMEDDYNRSGIQTSSSGDQLYMYYHEAAYLVQALEENGFGIISMPSLAYQAEDGSRVTDLLIIAKK